MDDRYRGIYNERKVVFANKDDMDRLNLNNGDFVSINTVSDDGIDRKVIDFKIVHYDIPPGCLAAYYPETNPLVPLNSVAADCGTPTYKSIAVRLVKQQT